MNIVSKKTDPIEGLRTLEHFYPDSGYSELLYSIWYDLAEDISFLNDGESPVYNRGLSLNNVNIFINRVAEQYLEIADMAMPKDFFHLAYCFECDHIGKPMQKKLGKSSFRKRLFNKQPTYQMVCSKCSSNNISYMAGYEARKKYLANIEK